MQVDKMITDSQDSLFQKRSLLLTTADIVLSNYRMNNTLNMSDLSL